jgi:hypothetical protein
MIARRNERLVENYTYYFGGLTEQEVQYQDYFETDLEDDPEDEAMEDHQDIHEMAMEGDMNPKLYEFIETSLTSEVHENFEDLIEDKIFKYKYRQFAESPAEFFKRNERV